MELALRLGEKVIIKVDQPLRHPCLRIYVNTQ